MKANVFIWRESIYKNNFVCSCGEELMRDGELNNTILYDEKRRMLVCPRGKKNVAIVTKEPIEVASDTVKPGRMDNLRGKWEGKLK